MANNRGSVIITFLLSEMSLMDTLPNEGVGSSVSISITTSEASEAESVSEPVGVEGLEVRSWQWEVGGGGGESWPGPVEGRGMVRSVGYSSGGGKSAYMASKYLKGEESVGGDSKVTLGCGVGLGGGEGKFAESRLSR